MLLITEHNDQGIDYITEDNKKTGNKERFIEGVFMQSEAENRNKRIYPKEVLAEAVRKYSTEQVSKGRAVGELDHPAGPTINLDKVSHKITSLKFEGNNVVGRALILDTPMGQIVKGLMDGGVKLGVSSRGMGTVEQKDGKTYVKDDYILSTVDIVQDPSAPKAFVDGIMEGVEWIMDNGVLTPVKMDGMRDALRGAKSAKLEETKINLWKEFVKNL